MIINELYNTILSRKTADPATSYTARLFVAGEDEIVKKVGEEAIEVILAAKSQGNARLVEEAADLTYHVLVLLAARGLSPADVETELARRKR
jgi:phosphoribosyl-ATP pyrophosphohydrolase